jgi:hypothetical protein
VLIQRERNEIQDIGPDEDSKQQLEQANSQDDIIEFL